MSLKEDLVEANEIRALIKTAMKDNINAGMLLGYTTNSTKVTYEGATRSRILLRAYDSDIATIEANIQRNGYRV